MRLALFLLLLCALPGAGQTHVFCPTDVNCDWTNKSTFQNVENIRYVNATTTGADWVAKINTQSTSLGNNSGEIWVFPSASSGTATTALSLQNPQQVIRFFSGPTTATFATTTGWTLSRKTQIFCTPGVVLSWPSATGTAFTWGSGTDTSWAPGGMDGCSISGNGGGSDTSIGIQAGNSTASAHGLTFRNLSISGFGNGFVQSGTGDAFGLLLDNVRIYSNACNGIRGDVTAGTLETSRISNSFIFNNGNNQAGCTGMLVNSGAGANMDWEIVNTNIESNSNGGTADISAPSTGFIDLLMNNVHMEHATAGPDTTLIEALSTGSNRSTIRIATSELYQNPGTLNSKAMINCAQCDLTASGTTFVQRAGASTTPAIQVGSGGVGASAALYGNAYQCNSGSTDVTKCQIIAIPSTVAAYDIAGSIQNNYNSATAVQNINSSSTGCHDLTSGLAGPGTTGARRCTGNIILANNNSGYQQLDPGGTARSLLNLDNGNNFNVGRSSFANMFLVAGGNSSPGNDIVFFNAAITELGRFKAANGTLLTTGPVISNAVACTNGELALSAGWQSTGTATVTAAAGTGQTCSWTITTGTTTAANPTVTDTLTNALPAATTVCWMNIYGGTHTPTAGESLRQTTLSATAPVFTANFTPTAGGTTYFVTRGCGP